MCQRIWLEIVFYFMSRRKKTIILLGGEGFIGRNISREISPEDDCFSIGIEKSFFPKRADKFVKLNPYREKIKGKGDIFVHLIDNKVAEKNFLKDEKRLASNLGMKSGCHLIIFSSAAVLADLQSPYGKRKKMLEKFYRDYCGSIGINLTIFRLFNTFGKYQMPYVQGSLVANIFANHLLGLPAQINDWYARRDFIYARDIGLAVKGAIEKKLFERVELGSGQLTSVRELVRTIREKILDRPLEVENKQKKDLVVSPAAEGKALKEILPALTPLATGLEETFRFYKNNIGIIKNHLGP